MTVRSVLLDARTTPDVWAQAISEISSASILGLDCETQDEARHAGLNAFNNGKRHVFDHRRTTMTGFSFYADGSDTAWYVNLAHADVDNRVGGHRLLEAIPADCIILAHNAPFELVMFEQCLGVQLKNVLCTLQLAVSHHGPDEYDTQKFLAASLDGFKPLAKSVMVAFADYDPASRGRNLNGDQQELLGKFIGKTSKAAHSYNGFIESLSYGYGLKKLVKSLFNFQMTEYKELLKAHGATHMGELTGEQVVAYGADDAYWAVRVYNELKGDLLRANPAALVAFLRQENPMVQVFAEAWRDGIRLDLEQVYVRQGTERVAMANVLRKLKALVRELLPFPTELHAGLLKEQDWYVKHGVAKRKQIVDWATSPDTDDDFAQCFQVSNPIGNAWAIEQGLKPPGSGKLNLTHYYGMRTLLHDLLGHKIVRVDGDISTDKDARARMLKTFETNEQTTHAAIMKLMLDMAEIEQRMKLFLTPYTQLMDPDTSRVYPSLSSMLASRRMAASFPNPMQLAKRGESTYVRSFYLPDDDDQIIISADWSSVELVLIGDQSRDPEFKKVFGQLPYGDLHSGAAVDCLAVKTVPGLTEEEFMQFKVGNNPGNRKLVNLDGAEVSPTAFYKEMRTKIGKGANFSHWFSGALSTVGELLGWTTDEMWEAAGLYKQRFAVAEAWRVGTGQEGTDYGFITLPDGHRRVRLEATPMWAEAMQRKFADISAQESLTAFADLCIKRIQTRARNQLVNSKIQGTCATLAKRSILKVKETADPAGARFLMPIHDELIYSVHRDYAAEFIPILRSAMCTHPDIVPSLPLACSVAVGRTFRPYDKLNPAFSQIELDEATPLDGVIDPEWEGKALPEDLIRRVIQFVADAKVAA